MKVPSSILLIFVFVSNFSPSVNAQEIVTGQVIAFNKYPLNKVSIESKKSKQQVFTDTLGYYSIEIKSKDKLHFQTTGFQSFTTKVSPNDTVNINLIYIDDNKSFEEVVKNGNMTEENLNIAIEKHLDENNNYYTFNSIYDVIQSIQSSVIIDEMNNPIRVYLPQKTFNLGDSPVEALYVVNDMITFDISDINPFEVKKIKIISGNEATLLYGNRGVNGVIIIETKR